ncbi:hypothetical protein AB0A76_14535 [Streptomyces exfoliatus]|uniref:Uncharacterized protein n=1 Tax=Streptomyces exfoliatus TaxID=1905 RepID=A0ABV3CW12_STREX
MTTPTTRTLLRATLATLALGGVTLAGASSAVAAPGDNGDVKVHKFTTPNSSQVNEPHVGCPFRLAAFNFDGLQSLHYEIFPQPGEPGNEDASVRSGNISVNANGDGATGPIHLKSGMYKVEWTWEGQQGAAKQKVFRVTCLPINGPTNGGPGGHGKPPHGPVGAGGGGSAQIAAEDTSTFGIGAAVAAGVAGTAGLVLIRRSRRRNDGAA